LPVSSNDGPGQPVMSGLKHHPFMNRIEDSHLPQFPAVMQKEALQGSRSSLIEADMQVQYRLSTASSPARSSQAVFSLDTSAFKPPIFLKYSL